MALETLFCNLIKKKDNKLKGFLQIILQDFLNKKQYLEHQTLDQRVVCPISPVNRGIILQINGFYGCPILAKRGGGAAVLALSMNE